MLTFLLLAIIKIGPKQAWEAKGWICSLGEENEKVQVTMITTPAEPVVTASQEITEKQLFDEINYFRAEKLTKKMLEKGLITADEYDKILAEARKIFVPIMAELM